MLQDFLVDFKREISFDYMSNGEKKTLHSYVKGISLNDLGELFSDDEVGHILLKAVEGIDIKNNDSEAVQKTFANLIDTKYAVAVYKVIAQCLFIKTESGEYVNCKSDYLILDQIPAHITIKFLSNIIELTLPQDENSLRSEIKKLMGLLTSK